MKQEYLKLIYLFPLHMILIVAGSVISTIGITFEVTESFIDSIEHAIDVKIKNVKGNHKGRFYVKL